MASSPLHAAADVVAALEAAGHEPEQVAPGYWRAYCPSHDARWPELEVCAVDGVGTLVDCDAGCRRSDVLREINMDGPE